MDIPLPKKGCDGFYSRSAKDSATVNVLAVVEEGLGGSVKVTPMYRSTKGSLSIGPGKTFQYHLNSETLEPVQLTIDGKDLYATYQQKNGQHILERHPLFEKNKSAIKFHIKEVQPRTLKAYNGYAYFTDSSNVHVVDLYQGHTPSCRLRSPFVDLPRGLEINDLTRDGTTLIAMNDSPLSKYVFFYQINNKGMAIPRYGAQLFYRDDLHYREITSVKNLLVVYGTYSKQGRTGHLMASFQIQHRVLSPLGQHEIPPPAPDAEMMPIPAWNGLAIVNNHVIISSPRGGIQIFNQRLQMDTRKEVKFDGFVTDLMVRNNVAYALTQTNSGSVVKVLRWDNAKKTLSVASTHQLPGLPNRFVR